MKVLHLIDSEGIFGAERVLFALADCQRRLGHEVAVANISADGNGQRAFQEEARRRELDLVRFNFASSFDLAGYLRMLARIRAARYDVIHCHTYKERIVLGLLGFWLGGARIVATYHGWTIKRGLRLKLFNLLDNLLSIRFAAVAVSAHTRSRLVFGKSAVVVPNPFQFDSDVTDPDLSGITRDAELVSRMQAARANGRKVVLSIGRLSFEKGYDRLVEYLGSARPKDFFFLVIGNGPEQQRLEQRAQELGLTDEQLFLAGYRDQAAAYLAWADAYVNLSRSEGLPITLLEAIGARVPFAVPAIPPLLDFLDSLEIDRNVAYDPEDAADFLRAIRAAMELDWQPVRERTSRYHAVDRIGQMYLDLYMSH